ncbi:MAG: Maf family protein [Flavobacteriales bacterium]
MGKICYGQRSYHFSLLVLAMDVIKNHTIILGSQSPRRKKLLAGLDIPFEVRVADIDESFPSNMPIPKIAEYVATQKWKALISNSKDDELIICSDTVVVLDKTILEKPKDKKDGKQMLQKLSGQKHTVITGVALGTRNEFHSFSDSTHVYFANLSAEEIDYYLDNYEPYDKAGSYGVQEWIGMMAIEKLEGSYYNVMGLPVQKLYQVLKNWG